MAQVVTKLFRRPENAAQALSDLKAKGYDVSVIEKGAEREIDAMGLSEQVADYYKNGLCIGGKVVKTSVDDAKVDEVNKILLATGFDKLTERPAQWSTSPGFIKASKMSATNPIDAVMTGDFRTY